MTTVEQSPLTFQDVWRMFQENAQSFKETERFMKERAAETERSFKETERLMKERDAETSLRFKETERSFKETERLMKDRDAETALRFKETDRIVKNLSKNIGDLGNRLGEFVEHMVAPAVVRLFQAEGIEVHEVHPGLESKRNGEGIEIDLLVVNDGTLVVVECKSNLTCAHVDEHLVRMEKFKRLLPLYKNHKALGAVAAMVMIDSVKDYAHSQGLYVLCQSGDSVEVSSPTGFQPKYW